MKLILTIFVVLVLLAGVSNAVGVLDLSTLNKNTTKQTIALPQVSPTMPTIAPTNLGGNVESNGSGSQQHWGKGSIKGLCNSDQGPNTYYCHAHVLGQEH